MASRRRKKKLGNFPFISVIFSTTLALLVIGLLGLFILKAQKLKNIIRENVEVQVFLKKQTSENEKLRLEKSLAAKDYIALDEAGQPRIEFIHRDSAARQFIEQTGEDILGILDNNPLLDAFVININPEYYNSEQMKQIQKDILNMSSVLEVNYQKDLITSINENISRITLLLGFFSLAFVLIVILLINNTIKLAMFSQRFLIRSMQLVGAKSSFIQYPFLTRSILYSLVSGILAGLLLYGFNQLIYEYIPDLEILFDLKSLLFLFAGLLVFGIMLGLFSTLNAVRKYMGMSLDELY
jgi:cell division transport system permease protein